MKRTYAACYCLALLPQSPRHMQPRADEASQGPSATASPVFSSSGQLAPVHIITCRLDYQVGGMFGLLGKSSARANDKFYKRER